MRIGRLPTTGRPTNRPPTVHRFRRDPERQTAAAPKPSVVRRPVPHRELHLRDVVTEIVIVLVRPSSARSFGNPSHPTRSPRHPCNNTSYHAAGVLALRRLPGHAGKALSCVPPRKMRSKYNRAFSHDPKEPSEWVLTKGYLGACPEPQTRLPSVTHCVLVEGGNGSRVGLLETGNFLAAGYGGG